MKLTDTACRAAKPRAKDYKLYDGMGLYLSVTPRGTKLWKMKYLHQGRERKLSLGSYPETSIKQAREQARIERELVKQGVDPLQNKKLQKLAMAMAAANTFEAVAEDYIAKIDKEGRAPATLIKARWALAHLSPSLGQRPIVEIKPFEIVAIMKHQADKGQLETARRIRAFASRVFRHGIATGCAESDPCFHLRGAVPSPKVKHYAAITDPALLGALLNDVKGYTGHPFTKIAIELSVHLFQRPGEIRQMKWSEIDFERKQWELSASRMKMRRKHRLPLSEPVIALLRQAYELSGSGKYVFPSLRSRTRSMSENTVNAALRNLGYSGEEITPHGFRGTASSMLNDTGLFTPDAVERSLSHRDKNSVRSAYDHGERWDERVLLHDWWSKKLSELAATDAARVKQAQSLTENFD